MPARCILAVSADKFFSFFGVKRFVVLALECYVFSTRATGRTMKAKVFLGIGLLVVTYLAFGCQDQGVDATTTGQIETMVTSTPVSSSPFGSLTQRAIAAAEVTVTQVFLIPVSGFSGEEIEIFNSSAGKTFDLMNLQNGLQAELSQATVPAGRYDQVRVVLSGARVTLTDGFTFSDDSTTQILVTPSAQESGVKVLLRNDLDIPEGALTTLVLDFNIAQNFIVQMDAQSETMVRRVSFTPVIQEFRRDIGPAE